jgi:DNA mismatch endonuclease (patch repair protein)
MPEASSPEALRRMKRQRRFDTRPEIAIRRLVHAKGLRYRVDAVLPVVGVRRRADMLFGRSKVAVFVDGCYWHSCPDHGTKPKANAEWWAEKLAANVSRDRDTDRRLAAVGWAVLRIWEHEEAESTAQKIDKLVRFRSQD